MDDLLGQLFPGLFGNRTQGNAAGASKKAPEPTAPGSVCGPAHEKWFRPAALTYYRQEPVPARYCEICKIEKAIEKGEFFARFGAFEIHLERMRKLGKVL